MPKMLVHPNENPKRIHPFRKAYSQQIRSVDIMRDRIMKLNGWSLATFYRKLSNDLPLTEKESEVVSRVMGIDVKSIQQFQLKFKPKRK